MLKLILLIITIYSITSASNSYRNKVSNKKKIHHLKIKPVTHSTTIIVNNFQHTLINKKNSKWLQIKQFELDFRRLLLMKGVKYQYKRDVFWRTWREIKDASGNRATVAYRSENIVPMNCTDCTGGFWLIEQNPPCPFEILSMLNDDDLCIFNYMNYENRNTSCPLKLKFRDITGICDNPIETEWRIAKAYGNGDKKKVKSVICEELYLCQIFTSYEILKDYVIFRIINLSNDIIYSRVMKAGGKNYACIRDCGHRDPVTKIITRII